MDASVFFLQFFPQKIGEAQASLHPQTRLYEFDYLLHGLKFPPEQQGSITGTAGTHTNLLFTP